MSYYLQFNNIHRCMYTKKKLFLSLPFAIPSFPPYHPFLLLSLQSFSLSVHFQYSIAIVLCCVPLAYLLILFGSFFFSLSQKLNEFCVIRLIYSHNSNGNKKSLSLINLRSSMSNDVQLCLGNRAHKIRKMKE